MKRIIDYCDYYLLIIGGRYSSTTEEKSSLKTLQYQQEKSFKYNHITHQVSFFYTYKL
ncbi:hypothetical protein [Colwellia sp. 12G3]|uniref:hypothetical protein n=1 Tax=Colwellia sp. 12G3 TaxID=2058299 RepID=UPI003FA4348A